MSKNVVEEFPLFQSEEELDAAFAAIGVVDLFEGIVPSPSSQGLASEWMCCFMAIFGEKQAMSNTHCIHCTLRF